MKLFSKCHMTCHEYLRWVRRGDFGLLAGVIVLFILGLRVIPTVLLLAGTVCAWRLYRCPECGCTFDPRVSLDKLTYCHSCGFDLTAHRMDENR